MLGEDEGVAMVGTGVMTVGRISISLASAILRVPVSLLYSPSAKILLLMRFFRLTFVGTSRVMAWESLVRR